ncbi:hypothetical protein T484DRAFT_3179836 [Baffinella frigidus]|nr:hypothetical protein T484DRAFT_3179836 [Cryptophyta sp. CCMP2293]
MIAAQPILTYNHRLCRPDDKFGDRCFEVLGLDVLIDAHLNPWLLELNHSPSLHTDAPVDASVKLPLVRDALELVAPLVAARAAHQPRAGGGGDAAASEEDAQRGALQGGGEGGEDDDADRPRYMPPGAEQFRWVARTEEEEAAWAALQQRRTVRRGRPRPRGRGHHRLQPLPPPGQGGRGGARGVPRLVGGGVEGASGGGSAVRGGGLGVGLRRRDLGLGCVGERP